MAIGIHPLTASIGAEITGVDLADISTETAEELRKAWLDHKVLVLRDQHISQEGTSPSVDCSATSRCTRSPRTTTRHPEIVVLEAGGGDGQDLCGRGMAQRCDLAGRAFHGVDPAWGDRPALWRRHVLRQRLRGISVCPTSGRSGSTISSRCTTTCGCFRPRCARRA